MYNKKGVSPLIATVLIIGFTIALAAVVMTWGGGFVRKTTEETEASADLVLKCATQVTYDIKTATRPSTLDGEGAVTATIENRGNIDVTALMFRFYSDGNVAGSFDTGNVPVGVTYTGPIGLSAFGVDTFVIPDSEIGNRVDEVEVIAKIDNPKGGDFTCGQTPRKRAVEVLALQMVPL